jgi:hypothetical protein
MNLNGRTCGKAVLGAWLALAVLAGAAGCRKQTVQRQLFDANVANDVMEKLTQYSSGQELARLENAGRYASVEELLAKGFLKSQFTNWLTSCPTPTPFEGYLVSEIQYGPEGEALDRRRYSGICAFAPAPAGKPSKKAAPKPLLLVLMDANDTASGAFYAALPEGPKTPLRNWPTGKELDQQFTRLEHKISNRLEDSSLDIDAPSAPGAR